jgi:hypothetical protein
MKLYKLELKLFLLTLSIALVLLGLFGCTPQDRSHCGFCKATGLCTLLGDDPNLIRKPFDANTALEDGYAPF